MLRAQQLTLDLGCAQGADIKISADSPIFGSSPFTDQSRRCGERGDRITFPASFFTAWNQTMAAWGHPAKLFVKEWAKFRYGVFDEFGFPGDRLYPNWYRLQDRVLPTGSSNAMLRGSWVFPNGSSQSCDPTEGGRCTFRPEGPNQQVTFFVYYFPPFLTIFYYFPPRPAKLSRLHGNLNFQGKLHLNILK